MTEDDLLFVGVDWATELHQACVLDARGEQLGERQVKHSGADLADFCRWLLELAGGDPQRVLVSIEIPHGAVVDTLIEQRFRVHAINPKQLDRFRDRFSTSGAKDDRRDALVLADSLRTDRRAFREIEPECAWVVELREQSRMHDELSAERTKLTNRMREQLRRYFPAFLEVDPDPSSDLARALFKLIPSPERAQEVKPYRVRKLLQAHRIRRIDADAVLAILRQPALRLADGAARAAVAHLEMLVERVALVVAQQRTVLATIESMLAAPSNDEDSEPKTKQRDAEILQSLPGVGRIVAATLLAEASRLFDARDYQRLRSLSGVAPVTKRSGKSIVVGMRSACHQRVRNAVYHWARVAAQHDPISKARYQALRARGASHGRALRTVGDRLLGVACAMLRDRTTWRQPEPASADAA